MNYANPVYVHSHLPYFCHRKILLWWVNISISAIFIKVYVTPQASINNRILLPLLLLRKINQWFIDRWRRIISQNIDIPILRFHVCNNSRLAIDMFRMENLVGKSLTGKCRLRKISLTNSYWKKVWTVFNYRSASSH